MPSAVSVSIVIGVLMPLFANIVPISRAFSSELRDSLDVFHNTVNDVTVKIAKLSEMGVSLSQTCIAVLCIVFGFITFYIVPYAFLFQDIPVRLFTHTYTHTHTHTHTHIYLSLIHI